MRTSIAIGLSVVAAGGAVGGAAGHRSAPTAGGTFRMNVSSTDIASVDPALGADNISSQVILATCGRLLYYPDRNGPAGAKLTPEIATGLPTVSSGGRRYTFSVRPGFRFSNGEAVTAAAFARAYDRALTPSMRAYAANFLHDVAGADAMLAGKANHVAGVKASGNTLTVTLTRPAPDFLVRSAIVSLCAIPPSFPADPSGSKLPPAAGPYYVTKREPNRFVELSRNPYYHGPRPHRVDRIQITTNTNPNQSLLQVEKGEVDYDSAPLPPTSHPQLSSKYGVNGSRYHVTPLLETDYVALNTSRPLLSDPAVRRAVNYALDRRRIELQVGPGAATPTDQILPPGMPGFRNVHLYPLDRPNVAHAKALMNGRAGKATLYIIQDPAASNEAVIIQANLKAIGIDVSVKQFPFATFLTAAGRKDAPYDLALLGWGADYADPADFINITLSGKNITPENNINLAHFSDPKYEGQMDAAARLTGDARYGAYARLDAALMRDAAPWAPLGNRTAREFVSKRVGCYVAQQVFPQLDLAAVCLK